MSHYQSPYKKRHSPLGGPLPAKAPAVEKNNVQQLLSYCRGIKADVGGNKIPDGQNLLGPIAHIERNLNKVQLNPADVRARCIRNVGQYLERLLPDQGTAPSKRQAHITQILTEARQYNG